jgi:membrane fusion protein (multidrug efflux system)
MTEKWKHKAISGDRNKALQSGVAGLLLAASVFVAGCGHPAAPPAGPRGPLPVTVYQVEPTNVPLTGEWVGILDGFTNAQIQPQATGYLVKQLYKEGSVVSQGQILFEIDPRPFRASLDSANAQLGQSQGSLAQAQAALGLAQINVNRDTPLAAAHAIAQSTLDNDTQQKLEAEANVATAQAAIKSAQATIETAKLNLGFTQVPYLGYRRGSSHPGRQPCQHLVGTDLSFKSRSHQVLLFDQRQRIPRVSKPCQEQRCRPASR